MRAMPTKQPWPSCASKPVSRVIAVCDCRRKECDSSQVTGHLNGLNQRNTKPKRLEGECSQDKLEVSLGSDY